MSATELPVATPRARRPTLAFGPFAFDPDNHLLRRDTTEIAAPPRVLGVLGLLLERAGDLVSRQDLIDRVWKDAFVTDTSLAEAVSALRQTLGDDPQAPTYIQTVHRRGYRFIAPVAARDRRAASVPFPAVAPTAPDEVVRPSIGGQLVPWSLAVLSTLLAIIAIYQLTHRQASRPVPVRFALHLDAGQRFDPAGTAVALSPDGSHAAWAACAADGCRIHVRALDALDSAALIGTEGGASPFYSPDGAWLGFFAGGKLKKISLAGGALTTIADVAQPLGAAWTTDGRIIFGSSLVSGLSQVPDSGGAQEPLTVPHQDQGEVRHAWPALAPDGRTLFFSIAATLEEDAPSRIAVTTLQGRSRVTAWVTLLTGAGIARPMAEDLLVVGRGAELQAVSFDPVRRLLVGVPQTLVPAVANVEGRAQFAVSSTGSLLYLSPDGTAAQGPKLGWWAEGGGPVPALPNLDVAGVPALSNDGRRIAWAGPADGIRSDIRVGDLDRGAVTRLTHDGSNSSPVWSPDGLRLYFARRDDGLFRIAAIDADGGRPALMPPAPHHAFPGAVSGDGRTLGFVVAGQDTKRDIWVVSTSGVPAPREIVHSSFDEGAPALSGDGSLLAYQSDESGHWDVYVQRIRDGRRAIVSTAGGERPFWARDGKAIVYRSGTMLMKAAVALETLTVGTPAAVADLKTEAALGIAPDGRVLLDRRPAFTGASAVIALHWDQEARRLLGPPAGTMPR